MTRSRCPACGSRRWLPILWGMPSGDDVDRLGDRVVFGGCCLPWPHVDRECQDCGHRWARTGTVRSG